MIDRVPGLASRTGHIRQLMTDKRTTARAHTRQFGDDIPRGTRLEVAVLKN